MCCGTGDLEVVDGAGLRLPVGGRVLGVQAGFDGVPGGRRWLGGQALVVGYRKLKFDQIQAGGQFGDRVLDLQAGVHLQEVELRGAVVGGVGKEFHCARTRVADRDGSQSGCLEKAFAHARRAFDQGRGRLFDDLLMAALDRALPFADRPYGAVPIGHHLNLDVTAARQVTLAEHALIAECRERLTTGGPHRVREVAEVDHHPHPAAPATGRRFDQYRQVFGAYRGRVEFGEHRHPGGRHHLLGLDLRAHRGDRGHRWSDPGQPGGDHCRREIGVLREESVSGVQRVGTGGPGGGGEFGRVEVAVDADPGVGFHDVRRTGIGVGVDRDGADAEPPAGGEHPPGDLASVGNQDSSDGHALLFALALIGTYIRKTPNLDAPSIGPLAMADKHIPSTVRVSRGSITPSS